MTISAPARASLAASFVAGFALAGLGHAAAQEDQSAAAVLSFADGVRAFNAGGRDEEARQAFAAAVDLDPADGTLRYWLGLAELRLGHGPEAAAAIAASLAASRPPEVDPLWVRHDLGQAQLAAGSAAEAARTLAGVAAEAEARLAGGAAEAASLRRLLRRALAGGAEALAHTGRDDEAGELRQRLEESAPAGASGAEPAKTPAALRRLEKRCAAGEKRLAAGKAAAAARLFEDVALDAEAGLARRESDEILFRRTLFRQAAALGALGDSPAAAETRTRAESLASGPSEPEALAIVAPPWTGRQEPAGAAPRWEGRIAVAETGDSNPSQLSESLSLNTPDAGLISGKSSDSASSVELRLAAHPLQDRRGWSLDATFDGRQSFYRELGLLDLGELQGALHLSHGKAPLGLLAGPLGLARVPVGFTRFTFLLQAGAGNISLDHRSYLTTSEASASFLLRHGRAAASQLDLHVLDRSFADEPAVGQRSGTEARARLSETFTLRREDRFLRLEALYGRRGAGPAFEGSLARGSAELALPLPGERFTLSLLGSWQRDDFDHPESDLFFRPFDPFDPHFDPLKEVGIPRTDNTLRAVAAVSWDAGSRFDVVARVAWIDRDSNLESTTGDNIDYRRTLASLGMEWSFR